MANEKAVQLDIGLGSELSIEIEGTDERLKAFLVGMERHRYLMIRLKPTLQIMGQMVRGTEFIVRYLFMGKVYGFRTRILGSIREPFRVTFISYPDLVENINLRKTQRMDCRLKATLKCNSKEIPGVIVDISAGGCRFESTITGEFNHREFPQNSDVILLFHLFKKEKRDEFHGKIRSFTRDNEILSCGIKFDKLDEKTTSRINSYVLDKLSHLTV